MRGIEYSSRAEGLDQPKGRPYRQEDPGKLSHGLELQGCL
jgi:hypothetical protein